MTSNRIPGAQQKHYQEIRLDKNEEEKIPGLDAYNHNRNRNYTTQTIAEDNVLFYLVFWVVFTQLKTFLVLIFSSQEKRCKKSFQLWGPFFRVFYSFLGQRKTPKTYSCSKPKRVFTFTTLLGARYLRLRYQYSILLQFCSTCIDCFMI